MELCPKSHRLSPDPKTHHPGLFPQPSICSLRSPESMTLFLKMVLGTCFLVFLVKLP